MRDDGSQPQHEGRERTFRPDIASLRPGTFHAMRTARKKSDATMIVSVSMYRISRIKLRKSVGRRYENHSV